jgi:hypothetical protein
VGNLKNHRFVAGLVCLLALFALIPSLAQAAEAPAAVAAPEAVNQDVPALGVLFGEKPACPEADKAGAVKAPVDPLEGAVFLLPVNPHPCPVSCEPNACMWMCAGGPRKCVNNCCVCLL